MAKFKMTHEEVNQAYDDAMLRKAARIRQQGQFGQQGQPGVPQVQPSSLIDKIRQMAQAKLGRPQP